MRRAEVTASSIAPTAQKYTERHNRRNSGEVWWAIQNIRSRWNPLQFLGAGLVLLLVILVPSTLLAQADCLACHADKGLQDAAGHNISVDGDTFGQSIHGSLKCNDCHADLKEYPHPDKIAKVQCDKCHAGPATELAGSVHSNSADHPCTSCHGDAHAIFTKDDKRSAVYPLNVPQDLRRLSRQ